MSAHEHGHPLPEAEYKQGVGEVGKMILILGVLTIVEVAVAIAWTEWLDWNKRALNIMLILMSLVKAVCIMAVFMHVKHEKKGFILTIAIPFLFLIWAVIAFLWEGNCWRHFQEMINMF